MRRFFCLAVAGAAVVVACTHDFAAFETAPETSDSAVADAYVPPATDAAPFPGVDDDAGADAADAPDATAEAGCDAGCVNTEKTCHATCNSTATACEQKCRQGDFGCYFGCTGAQSNCRKACTSTCRSCSQNLCTSQACSQ